MSDDGQLRPFEFEGQEIRFVGTIEIPEWVAADIVAVLYPEAERSSYNKYLDSVPSEWKGKKKVLTLGGNQDVVTLFEPGLYALIARSNSPKAVPFQKWVYEDVLPSIRKTGSYSTKQQSVLPPPQKEQLENIRLGMDLLYELGGIDERTQLALKDIVRDIQL
jgi:prophage antirepressor-like protein